MIDPTSRSKPAPWTSVCVRKPTSASKTVAKAGEATSKLATSVTTSIFTFLNFPPLGRPDGLLLCSRFCACPDGGLPRTLYYVCFDTSLMHVDGNIQYAIRSILKWRFCIAKVRTEERGNYGSET